MAGVIPVWDFWSWAVRWWGRNRLFFWRDLFLVGLFMSVSLFWVGYHNADLGQNIRFLNAEYDLNLEDRSLNGVFYSGVELHALGCQMMIWAFVFGFGLAWCFGDIQRQIDSLVKQ